MAGREDAEAGEPALIQLPACRIVTVRELCEQVGALANAQVRFVARSAAARAAHLARPRAARAPPPLV